MLNIQDKVKKLSSLVGRERDPNILQDIERGTFKFVYLSPESALTTESRKRTLSGEFDRRDCE